MNKKAKRIPIGSKFVRVKDADVVTLLQYLLHDDFIEAESLHKTGYRKFGFCFRMKKKITLPK